MKAKKPNVTAPIDVRVEAAIDVIVKYGEIDGAHHKQWVLAQALRHLLGERDYKAFTETCEKHGAPYDEGIAP